MHNLRDLKIEEEILPLFDYSLNGFTKNKILDILKTPLGSTLDIIHRQNILKGFTDNKKILHDYSYTVLYVNEVYHFLNEDKIEGFLKKKFTYRYFTSRQVKARYASKFNQLILFFHRLESKYFLRLRLQSFPKEYESNLKQIVQFLSYFELNKYEYIIREKRLKDKHIFELTGKIQRLKEDDLITPFWEQLFLFEAYLSISWGVSNNNFTYPVFRNKGIKLTDLFHPLIEDPVKNNFETTSNVVVLNGPNMSGKSTFLKTVAICMYLGHVGIGIPASSGEIPFCNNFSIDINRRDDIQKGYSHFMMEVMNLKSVVNQVSAGKRCFAVFDEMFSGTNVEDGFEICKTTLLGLSKFDTSYFFISTHIQELKTISNDLIATYYIDCELRDDKPTFTYQLKSGWSDIKVGRILFEKEGLNDLLN